MRRRFFIKQETATGIACCLVGSGRCIRDSGSYPETLSSNDTESYRSCSSNGRWVVFSSRRLDGLYTRPFIAYVGKDGKTGKPFLLPQKEADYYAGLMKSYNIPEFVTGKVTNRSYQIRRLAEQGGISVSCSTF